MLRRATEKSAIFHIFDYIFNNLRTIFLKIDTQLRQGVYFKGVTSNFDDRRFFPPRRTLSQFFAFVRIWWNLSIFKFDLHNKYAFYNIDYKKEIKENCMLFLFHDTKKTFFFLFSYYKIDIKKQVHVNTKCACWFLAWCFFIYQRRYVQKIRMRIFYLRHFSGLLMQFVIIAHAPGDRSLMFNLPEITNREREDRIED